MIVKSVYVFFQSEPGKAQKVLDWLSESHIKLKDVESFYYASEGSSTRMDSGEMLINVTPQLYIRCRDKNKTYTGKVNV